jgi:endonuclease/exonuclease/phosphatase family metal-dependent hydrolase
MHISSSIFHQAFITCGILCISIYKAPREKLNALFSILDPLLRAYNNMPIVIGGDFNVSPSKSTAFFMANFDIFWSRPENTYSFKSHAGSTLIDHIFVNNSGELLLQWHR